MAIFLVSPTDAPEAIEQALEAQKAEGVLEFIALPRNGYFVSYKGTTEELSGLLGITDGSKGTGVVVLVTSYYGRTRNNIWEWIQSRRES